MYLWLKFFHLFFMVAWFAGLFYLPRLYVNLAMAQSESEYQRLLLMSRKLFKFMTPWAIGTVVLGLSMPITHHNWAAWIHAKIALGVLLVIYHIWCGVLLRRFANKTNRHSHKWFRVFNELPVFILLMAIYLAVFKPF